MIVLSLLILSIVFWLNNKKAISVTLLWAFTCNGFNLKGITPSPINIYNLLFLVLNIVLISDISKKGFKSLLHTDKMLKYILMFYIFLIIHCIMTILLNIEIFKYATSVLRQTIAPFLLFLLIRKLDINIIQKIFKYILFIMGILCFIYLLQSFGIYLYQTREGLLDGESTRVGNLGGVEFCLILSLFVFKNKLKSVLYLIPLIYGAMRGPIVSLLCGILYSLRHKIVKIRYFIIALIVGLLLYSVYTNLISDRFNRYDVSFTEEVISGINIKKIMDFSSYEGSNREVFTWQENGTFVFRISMLAERIIYLFQNPEKILFGAGMIDEASPKNDFHFKLGTPNENYKYQYCQIESNDILWTSYLLRYGIIGILFWIVLFHVCFKQFNNRQDQVNLVGLSYTLFLIINSFGSDSPRRIPVILMLFLIYTYSKKVSYDS